MIRAYASSVRPATRGFQRFGAEFLRSVNRIQAVAGRTHTRLRDMWPSRAELREAFFSLLRGAFTGTLFGAMPCIGPTITTFIAYTLERKVSRHPEPAFMGIGAILILVRVWFGMRAIHRGRQERQHSAVLFG